MGYGSNATDDTEKSRFQTPSDGKGKGKPKAAKPAKGKPPKAKKK